MLNLFQSVIFIRGEYRADMCLWRVRPRQTIVCDDSQSTERMISTVWLCFRERNMIEADELSEGLMKTGPQW